MTVISETNVVHGMSKLFKIDNSGGSLTDISTAIDDVTIGRSTDEADAGGGGVDKVTKLGKKSADLSISGTVTAGAGEAYLVLVGVWGSSGLDFEFGPGGSGAGQPKTVGKCHIANVETKSDANGVPKFTAKGKVDTANTTDSVYSA